MCESVCVCVCVCVCVFCCGLVFLKKFYSSISEASPLTYLNKRDDGVLFLSLFLKGENVPRERVLEAERNDEHFEYYCLPECILNTSSICFQTASLRCSSALVFRGRWIHRFLSFTLVSFITSVKTRTKSIFSSTYNLIRLLRGLVVLQRRDTCCCAVVHSRAVGIFRNNWKGPPRLRDASVEDQVYWVLEVFVLLK